jgi:hypothetical protein
MSDNNDDDITISGLRGYLFDALRGLKAGKMEVGTALAVAKIGEVLVDTAKVELRAMELSGRKKGTGFLKEVTEPTLLPAPAQVEGTPGTLPRRFFDGKPVEDVEPRDMQH